MISRKLRLEHLKPARHRGKGMPESLEVRGSPPVVDEGGFVIRAQVKDDSKMGGVGLLTDTKHCDISGMVLDSIGIV